MAPLAAALFLLHALTLPAGRCDAPHTQAEMNACAAEDFLRADARLNAVYKQAMKAIDPARQPKLKAAQRAWLAFRDAECEFEASEAEGGTMQPMLRNGCKAEVTKARIAQLTAAR
jgi:uncharacterized protein YecT (DUF1311 family)